MCLLLCTLFSFCAFAAEPTTQNLSDEPIVKCLMNLDSLERYHVFVYDEEIDKQWVIDHRNERIEIFLVPEGDVERIYADQDKRKELLDEFDKSIEFVIKAVSTIKPNERERIFDSKTTLDIFSFEDFREGSVVNVEDVEAFYIFSFSDIYSGQIYSIQYIPFIVKQEYSPIEMYVGYAYGDEVPKFEGVENSIEVEVGDNKQDLIDEMGVPVYDFGSVCVYEDEYGNSVIVDFSDDAVSCFVGFTTKGNLLLTSDFYPISGEMIEMYQGKTVKELQSRYGEFHCYLDLNGAEVPAYITKGASIVCFVLDNDNVESIYSIDVLTGSVHEMFVTP